MFNLNISEIIGELQENIFGNIRNFIIEKGPDIFWAFIILLVGFFISLFIYRFIMFLFKKFKIIALIDKLDIEFEDEKKKGLKFKKEPKKKFSETFGNKIQIDKVVAKASSYYVFLLFFRWSVTKFTSQVETFLDDLLNYLPSLFVGIITLYFGIRFADFVYDVVYHSMNMAKQKTLSKVLAIGAKIIILFFTLILVLNYTKIVDQTIIDAILTGFIAMITIAGGLAFGLGGKDIAKEILEGFKK